MEPLTKDSLQRKNQPVTFFYKERKSTTVVLTGGGNNRSENTREVINSSKTYLRVKNHNSHICLMEELILSHDY
jgi:hypothetical protein